MDTSDTQPESASPETPDTETGQSAAAVNAGPVFTLKSGDRIGADYTVLEPLGAGSMGEVYRVRHEGVHREYALKILSQVLAGDPTYGAEMRKRFQREAGVLAHLSHPNIVPFGHFSEDAGRKLPFLTMEFVCSSKGRPETLQDRVGSMSGGLPETEVKHYALQLCDALAHAHGWGSEGVIHRDLKPGNILLRARDERDGGIDDDALIADFGLVKVLGGDARAIMGTIFASMRTVPGTGGSDSTLVGNLAFMSPEQSNGAEATAKSDLYALGAIIYYMLTGERPEGRFKLPSDLGFNRAWDAVINACLQPRAKDRIGSAGELKSLIERVQVGKRRRGVRKGGASVPLAIRRFGKAALWAAVLLVLAGGGWYGWRTIMPLEGEPAVSRDAEHETNVALEGEAVPSRPTRETPATGPDVRLRYAEAKQAYDAAMALADGQGFETLKRDLETSWIAADRAERLEAWDEAWEAYGRVLSQAERMGELDVSRRGADARMAEADAARQDAQLANASTDAPDLWSAGGQASSRAAERFASGDFDAASTAWDEARAAYHQSVTQSRALQAYRKAKSDYETELGWPTSASAMLLKGHGGDRWGEVQLLAQAGAASADNPDAGRQTYERAVTGLPAAIEEARQRQRASRINAALNDAREAKDGERWQAVVDAAKRVLDIDANHPEASELKREAEDNMAPSWKLITTVDRRAVPGTITIGGQNYQSGQVIPLREGQRYTAEFSYEDGGRRYKADAVMVTADWHGVSERHVALQEVRGPVDGQNWTSPATGMEFVWIDEMEMWVGKFEVTNEEYRKMKPDHNSGAFGGHSLNDDRQPVVRVNFDDAKAYAEWLTHQDRAILGGARYRLPSNDEWTTFAQCGDKRIYPWGNEWPPPSGRAGNYLDRISGYTSGFPVTAEVDKLWENPWGLYGVGGNVWEACASDSSGGSFGAWRGASWHAHIQDRLRVSTRRDRVGSARVSSNGFRLLLFR